MRVSRNRSSVFVLCALAVLAAPCGFAEPAKNWHEDAFFGLHYDLHPGATDTELGRESTYEHIRAMLEKVKPDFVQYDCKGHPGYSGYPTKVGSPSPGIVGDALKVWRQVTRDMGIPLSIHFSGVWDSRAIELHPEWARINAQGKPDPNYTSRLSAYDEEYMIPQLLEVVREYDIDGMWIDGENWASQPDWSEACQKAFTEKTGIAEIPRKAGDPHWHEWLAFNRELFVNHVTRYVDAVHALKPTCMVTSNWMYSVRMPEAVAAPIDYLSGDFDPSFGAERAMAEGRFISSRGKPWDLMAWAFLQTGGQGWTMKNAEHLCQELSTVLAQGGAVFIYDTPHRSGRLTEWHQDILADVAKFCRPRQEYCHKSETVPQVAILHSETAYYLHNDPLFNFAQANRAMEGALHAVLENGLSADILNEDTLLKRLSEYPVVIIPEAVEVSDAVRQALPGYVENGGRLLLTGAQVAEQYGALAGVEKRGEPEEGGWLPVGGEAVNVAGGYQAVTLKDAEAVAFMLNEREPALNARADFPAATRRRVGRGTVVAVHGPVFRCYYESHYPALRRFIGDMVAALNPAPMARVDGPWWIEMAARKKDGRTLIQLVNRSVGGYLSPSRHMAESVPDTGPFTVTVPLPEKPAGVFLAPEDKGLEWSWDGGLLTAKVGGLGIHNVLVIEPGTPGS
ncbi:MAG TPA: alpha-L-fucosidase [Candidatus Hydrogenedentes bacterium]|nr:alpha-L-fucosidase [Candidatus Hydrogenedentota bacterium]